MSNTSAENQNNKPAASTTNEPQLLAESGVKAEVKPSHIDGVNDAELLADAPFELDSSAADTVDAVVATEVQSEQAEQVQLAKFVEEDEEVLPEGMLDASDIDPALTAQADAPQEQADQMSTDTPSEEASATSGGAEATAGAGVGFGGVLLGAGLLGAAVAGGSSSSDEPATGFTSSGLISLGQVTSADGLELTAYKADGTQLSGTATINDDGTYTFVSTEDYSGPVLLRLVDTDDATANYNDEATEVAASLTSDLRVVVNVASGGTVTAAITPLTELAVRELLGDAGGDAGTSSTNLNNATTAEVTAANTSVATAFGLPSITISAVTVDAAGFDSTDDLSAAEQIGQILAAISAIESDLGIDTAEAINLLANAVDDGALDQTVVELIQDGLNTINTGGTYAVDTTALDALSGSVIDLALSADTGKFDGDFVTQTAAQTLTATVTDFDAATQVLWLSVDGGESWVDVSGSVVAGALSHAVTLAGKSTIKLAITSDAAEYDSSLVVGSITSQSYAVDTVGPVFTSPATVSVAENTTGAAYSAAVTDDAQVTYSLSGEDAGLFNLDPVSGVLSFKASPDFEAPADVGNDNGYVVQITATDLAGNAATHDITISVTDANEAPAITSGAVAADFVENTSGGVYTAAAEDVDANTTISYSISGTDAALFNIDAASGEVTFKQAPNFEAPADSSADNIYNFTVTASDGALSDDQAVAVTVVDANDLPSVTSAATVSVDENSKVGTLVYTATASDEDGDVLTYALSGADAASFELDSATGELKLAEVPNFEVKSSYAVTLTADDGADGSDSVNLEISVKDVNEAPTSTAITPSPVVSGQAYSFDASATFNDVDGDTLTYTATGLPAGLSITSAGELIGTVTLPDGETLTTSSVTVSATDGGFVSEQTFDLSVVTAPVILSVASTSGTVASGEGVALTATLSEAVVVAGTITVTLNNSAGDLDDIDLVYTGDGSTSVSQLVFSAGTALGGDANDIEITNIVLSETVIGQTSGQGLVTTATGQSVSGLIVDNSAPSFTSAAATADFAENGAGVAYAAAADDVTQLTFSITGGADSALFDIDATTGEVSFKVAPDFETPLDVGADNVYDVTVTATDGQNQTADQTVQITVSDVNEAPVLADDAPSEVAFGVNVAISETVDIFVDPDGDTLTYTVTGLPSGVTFDPETNTISGAATALGSGTLSIVASDGEFTTAAHSIDWSIVDLPTISSNVDDVTNLDVTSDIVLIASENVSVGSGSIRIVNDGGDGFHGEAIDNSFTIDVTSDAVSIVNNIITIAMPSDLDFANDYHVEIDAGAFVGGLSGLASVAVTDETAINFSTVTPGAGYTAAFNAETLEVTYTPNANESVEMISDGTLAASLMWLDAEPGLGTSAGLGNGNPATGDVERDFSTGDFGLVIADYGLDDIQTNDFYLSLIGFGEGDHVYVDNLGDNSLARQTSFDGGLIIDNGTEPTEVVFGASGDLELGQNGGQLDVYVQGGGVFSTTSALIDLLALSAGDQPLYYG